MRMLFSVLLLLLWPKPALPPQAPEAVDASQTRILALENAWNQAEEHKDIKALDSLLDPTLSTSTMTAP